MAIRFISKNVIPSLRSYSIFNPFLKHSSVCIVSVLPIQMRKFHLTSNLFKELVRFNLADIGEGIKEVVIKDWYIQVGDRVSQFNNICEVQSDKATVTITSRYDGLVKKIYYNIDDVALVGKPLIDIEIDTPIEDDHASNEIICESDDLESQEAHRGSKVSTTPSVRKLAKENNINLGEVVATGPHGRILKDDVVNYINSKTHTSKDLKQPVKANEEFTIRKSVSQSSSKTIPQSSNTLIHQSPKNEIPKDDKIIAMTLLQKTMLKTMTKANSIPHFTLCDEVDVTNLSDMKNSICSTLTDVKMTFMPFFIKAISIAMLQFPQVNAQLDESNGKIIYKANHNIGFAIDSPDGLIVPKIHSVQNKTLMDISEEMKLLINKAKQGKLSLEDLSNGTFTLSNIGSIGGTYAAPVILYPEIAIGAIGRIQNLPRFNDKNEVISARIMNISWAADHRVLDGATITRFSNLWKLYIEKPEMLMINLR